MPTIFDECYLTQPNYEDYLVIKYHETGTEYLSLMGFINELLDLFSRKEEIKIKAKTFSNHNYVIKRIFLIHEIELEGLVTYHLYLNPVLDDKEKVENQYYNCMSKKLNNFGQFIKTLEKLIETSQFSLEGFQYSLCPLIKTYTFTAPGEECHLCKNTHLPKQSGNLDPSPSHKGYVYVIEDQEDVCKIGFSRHLPETRNKQLTVTYHKEFRLVGYFKSMDPAKDEKELHQLFAKYRIKGEWFKMTYQEIKEKAPYLFIDIEEPRLPIPSKCA